MFIPEGWSFEDYNEYEVAGLMREDFSEFNKRNSSTHVARAGVEPSTDPDDPEGTQYVAHFSFPFDY